MRLTVMAFVARSHVRLYAFLARAQLRLADLDVARRDLLVRRADEAMDSAERRIAIVRDLAARCGIHGA